MIRNGLTRRGLGGAAGAATVAAAMAACAPGGETSAPKDLKAIKGQVIWQTRGGEVERMGQQQVLMPLFKEVAPNIEVVQAEIAGGSGPYNDKLLADFAAGSPPDVWGFGMNYFGYWVRGMVADLSPLINRDKFDMNQFLPGLADKFKIKGKQFGLPQLTTFGTLVFYNKNHFDDAGLKYPPVDWDDKTWTFDRMVEYAQKMTKRPGQPDAQYGLESFGGSKPEMPVWIFGGDAFMKEHYEVGVAPTTRIDSPESIAAHEAIQDVRWKYYVSPQSGKDPSNPNFQAGGRSMLIGGGWNFWGYTTIKDFKWAAAAVPTKVTNKNTAYNDFWELGAQSKNKDAAWEFMKHLVNPEVQKKYTEITGTPPTTKAALDTWYKRYESSTLAMTRAELEKVTQGAIDPKRSIESPDHTHIDYYRYNPEYTSKILTPIERNEGRPREVIARSKDVLNNLIKEIHDTYKDRVAKA